MRQSVNLPLLLLCKTTLRHWRQGWPSYVVLLCIVAVGVGAFNGIRQASRAASANFGLFNEAVSGRSDFIIEASAGGLDQAMLDELAALAMDPDWHLLPVVEGSVAQTDHAPFPQEVSNRMLGQRPRLQAGIQGHHIWHFAVR